MGAEKVERTSEAKKPDGPFVRWIKENSWIIVVCLGLLVYLGLAFPIYTTKLSSDPDNRINVYFFEMISGGVYGFNGWILAFWLLPLIGVILACLTKVNKNFLTAALMVFLVGGILILTGKEIFTYFLDGSFNDSPILVYSKTDYAFGGVFAGIASIIVALAALLVSTGKESYSLYEMVESGMLVAMAVVLQFIKIPVNIGGGSLNLQMLPLFVLALRMGPLKGFLGAGVVFGLITCLTDGYGFACYPFDYLLAFGACGIMGFFKPLIFGEKQNGYNLKGEVFLLVGGLLAGLGRMLGDTISSIVLYGYTLGAALVFNLYALASAGIAVAVLMALYGPICKLNRRFPMRQFSEEK